MPSTRRRIFVCAMKSPALRILLLFCVLYLPSSAQNRVSITDTSVVRGLHVLMLRIQGDVMARDTFHVRVMYDRRLLDLREIRCEDSSIQTTSFSVQTLTGNEAECSFSLFVQRTPSNGVVVMNMDVDVLAGSDTITRAEPRECLRNGTVFTSQYTGGTIHILDAPIGISRTEYVGPAYPTATSMPTFRYYLALPGTVVFTVYDVVGRVLTEESITTSVGGTQEYKPRSESFLYLCDGPYILRMQTLVGQYSTPFIIMH